MRHPALRPGATLAVCPTKEAEATGLGEVTQHVGTAPPQEQGSERRRADNARGVNMAAQPVMDDLLLHTEPSRQTG